MSSPLSPAGFPPSSVTTLLRLEGVLVLGAALLAYHGLGGNWWLFALLLLVPDLSMLGALLGPVIGAKAYNAAHTYLVPGLFGLAAWALGLTFLAPFALIWVAHIAMDRALGFGLKYPGLDHHTHLGLIGKARKEANALANPA